MKKKNKCMGCGINLQNDNILNLGYTPNLDNDYCMRCFKVKNYGEIENVTNDEEKYNDILKSINRSKDLVLYIVDILNIREDLDYFKDILNNDIILILNKKDILPKSVKDDKIINYLKERYNFLDIIIISTKNNYNMDLLFKKINKYKKSNNVYLVGETNAGKSSVINKMISNYSKEDLLLTTSALPGMTLNKIEVKISDKLTLIDTPGFIDQTNVINCLDKKYYKILNPKYEIRPRTYRIFKGQSLLIGDIVRIDYLEGDLNSYTAYIPNHIKIKKINSRHDYLKELSYKEYELGFREDLVIYGLGFIKTVINSKIGIYINKDVKTFIRKNLI